MEIVRIDPRTKLLLFIITGAFVMSSTVTVPCILWSSYLAVLLFLSGRKKVAIQSLLLYLVWTLILPPICQTIPGSIGTLVMSLAVLLRLFTPIIMALLLVFKTTTISEFIAALGKMHLPNQVVIPVAIMFRFIPTVQEEWQSIRKAMAFRGISLKFWEIIKHPLRTMEYVLIPLMISAVNIMDELAAASLARGLDSSKKRTSLITVKLQAKDYLIMVLTIPFIVFAYLHGLGGAVWFA